MHANLSIQHVVPGLEWLNRAIRYHGERAETAEGLGYVVWLNALPYVGNGRPLEMEAETAPDLAIQGVGGTEEG